MALRILAAVSLASAAAAASVGQAASSLRSGGGGFVKALEFRRRLRVCNAYPLAAGVDVYRRDEKLTSDASMPYKQCRDFTAPLQVGDKIDFKVGDSSAGTFAISELPSGDAVLLLVMHRHDADSTAVAFESHVFANTKSAQIAVIDTYKGAAHSKPRIMDMQKGDKAPARAEELRYDSVVAVTPGLYEVELDGQDGETKAKSELVALGHESYVVIRTGVEAKEGGKAFPQELLVFPKSDAEALRSGARTSGPSALALALVAAVASGLRLW